MGLLSSLFRQRSNGEESLKRAITVAYARVGENTPTRIPWWEAENFVATRGEDVNVWDDGGVTASVHMLVNGEEVTVTFIKHRDNGTTLVSAENTAKRRVAHQEYMKTLGIDI